jgi:predicted secreted protein
MANEKYLGRNFLVKLEDSPGAGTFTTVANMKTTGEAIATAFIDTTDKDSGTWREGIEGGRQSVDLTLAGPVSNGATQKAMRALAMAGAIRLFKLVSDLGDVLQGKFHVSSFDRNGGDDDAEQFTMKLASAGPQSYTPEP